MAVLDREKLVELNNYMLGLGQPDEKDDVGYNKPDWFLMSNLAYIPPTELKEEHIAVMVDKLRHYTNTQLQSYKTDLAETMSLYDDKLRHNREYIGYTQFGDTTFLKDANAKYIPNEMRKQVHYNIISVVSYNEKGLLLDFEDTNTAHRFKNSHEGVHYSSVNGKWYLFVPYENVEEFMNVMRTAKKEGIDGYQPNEAFEKILNNLDAFKEHAVAKKHAQQQEQLKKDNEKKIVSLVRLDKDEEKVTVFYSAFSREMVDFKNEHRNKVALRQENGQWNTVIAFDFLDEWIKKATKEGLVVSQEVKAIDVNAIAIEKINKHINNHKLVDINTLPLPFEPYPFQLEDATRLLKRDKMLIGHDMGCGKTFISGLVGVSLPTRKLVICPETLRINWKKEMKSLGAEANILYSKDEFKLSDNPNSFTIMGYQTAHKFKDEIIKAGFDVVFVDEVHNCKAVDNKGVAGSNRAESVMEITGQAKYVYLISGTPEPTRNKDLFNIFKMLDAKEFNFNNEWAFFNYGKKYCDGQNNGFGWDFNGNSNSEELHQILSQYMVRRTKKEVLPHLTKQRIFIPIEVDNREYRGIEKRLINMDDGDTYMGLAMSGRRILSESKVKSAIEFADGLLAEDKSVVIVSNFNETLDTLKEKYGDNACVIRGGMSDVAKQQAIDDFQSGKCKVCAINIIAGGVGVTLTKAHDMIVCDYDWTPANMIQVEDRICRSGQTEPCNIHYLYGEDCIVDEVFVGMITEKNANIDRVVDNSENSMDLTDALINNSNSFMELLKDRVEKEKVKFFEEKDIFSKVPMEYGNVSFDIKKSENDGLYDVAVSVNGKVIDYTTFTQSHIAFMTTDKEKTTITKVKKTLKKQAEGYLKQAEKEDNKNDMDLSDR